MFSKPVSLVTADLQFHKPESIVYLRGLGQYSDEFLPAHLAVHLLAFFLCLELTSFGLFEERCLFPQDLVEVRGQYSLIKFFPPHFGRNGSKVPKL